MSPLYGYCHQYPFYTIGGFLKNHQHRLMSAITSLATTIFIAGSLSLGLTSTVYAQDCKNRGDLDALYCDENGNMTADAPKDAKRLKNPRTLMLTYSPQEDPATYEKMWQPYVAHMNTCTKRPMRFLQVHSSAASIEAMRSGRVQMSLLSAGDTPFAVNVAGAVPFANHGTEKGGITAYHLIVVVKADSAIKSMRDLKDKRVAHVSPSSNSGNLAPRALFPAEGVTPDKDYKVLYSGKHDNSIAGVARGDYDAAAVADDVLIRMIQRGAVKENELRVLYKSRPFPAGSLAYAHDLDPALVKTITDCTFAFRFPPELSNAFRGPDRFVPLDYKKDFESVRRVATASGEVFSQAALNSRAQAQTPTPPKK
jgi:phosphonate transport system substrate-binding protein